MIALHELIQAVQAGFLLLCITIISHGIVTAAGHVIGSIARGIAENVKK